MLTIWRFSDGKRGHENQSLGLAEALCRLSPCQVETLHIERGWPHAFAWLTGRFAPGDGLPKPDLLVGAGHATHWPMLAARRAHGGRIAVLMKPSLPLAWFDWVIAPSHDFPDHPLPSPPPSRGRGFEASPPASGGRELEPDSEMLNRKTGSPPASGGSEVEAGPRPQCGRGEVILTEGPINRIRPGTAKDPQRGLMLIGGPSGEYGWSETALMKQIQLIALHQPGVGWHLTTSRRTPHGFLADLAGLKLANVEAVAHDQVPPGWLPEQLARAAQVWVTPDSASMVYEALSSGASVGVFELPYARPGRVARGLQRLMRENRLTAFADWERSGRLEPNDQPLNEAERIARHLLTCLNRAN